MKRDLLDRICCPTCHARLDLAETEARDDRVLEGTLTCPACRAVYPLVKGIPNLLPSGGRGDDRTSRENEGWVSLWEEKGYYQTPNYESSFRAPYLDGPWETVALAFEAALKEMDLRGGETILDLGAGQGWASRHFAERGARVVAMDVVPDELYGLGRAWAIMEHAGVYFEPIVGDGLHLPFPAGTFDVVFFCGALHHFERFDVVLREVRRVLRPDGRMIATSEPAISVATRERDVQAGIEEVKKGIVERRPRVLGYWLPLVRAGFRRVKIDSLQTYRATPEQTIAWIVAAELRALAAVRTRYRPLVRLGFALLRRLPYRLSGQLLLLLGGGILLIRANAPTR